MWMVICSLFIHVQWQSFFWGGVWGGIKVPRPPAPTSPMGHLGEVG